VTISVSGATLTPPVSDRDHVLGPPTAPITLVEYGDYECPYCGAAQPIVHEIVRRLGSELRFVFRHFPMTRVHPHAERAAEAAEATSAQFPTRFWEMHEQLYAHQHALEDEDLLVYAAAIGLDLPRFARELELGVHAPRVREDFLSGVRSGVNGTPTFFINGRRHDGGYDLPTMLATIAATAAMHDGG
jgi:protein-disulfide isomerase